MRAVSLKHLEAVVRISEVMASRGLRALEGEGRGSHLEVIARGAVVAPASQ